MADLLSQNEIDALLRALKGGEGEAALNKGNERVKVYDFKSANKFSKEHIKILHNIYENFSQLFSTYLSGTLRTNCQVDVVSVEEQKYYEYINSLPAPTVLAILDISPMGSPSLLELSPVISYELINRLLGGVGGEPKATNHFTEIDLALLERTFLHLIKLIDTSWSKVIKVKTIFERIETNPQFAQIISYNETIAIITIRVAIGDKVEGFINVCIPHIAIEPIAKKLNTRIWFTSGRTISSDESAKHYIKQKLVRSRVSVAVTFNDTTANLGEILDLQKGDVLQLVHKVDEKLIVKIDGKSKFLGELGVMKDQYVVRITDTIKEEDND